MVEMQRPPQIPTPTPEIRKWSDIGDQKPSGELDPTLNSLDANGNLLEGGIPVTEKRYNNPGEAISGYFDANATSATGRTRLLDVQENEHIRLYYKQPDGSVLVRDYISHEQQRQLQFIDTQFAVTNGSPEVVILRGPDDDAILNQMIEAYDKKIGLDEQARADLDNKASSPATELRTQILKDEINFTGEDHPNAVQRKIMGIEHPDAWKSQTNIDQITGEQQATPTKDIVAGDIISDTIRVTPAEQFPHTRQTPTATPEATVTKPASTRETTPIANVTPETTPEATPQPSTPEIAAPEVITDFRQLKHEIKIEDGRQYLYLTIPAGMDAFFTRMDSNGVIEHTHIDQLSKEQGGVDIPLRIEIEGDDQRGYDFTIIASEDQTTANPVDAAVADVEEQIQDLENMSQKETTYNDGDIVITTTKIPIQSKNSTP